MALNLFERRPEARPPALHTPPARPLAGEFRPQERVNPAEFRGVKPGTRAGENIAKGARVGLGLAGAGLLIGLSEGIPRAFGGQGPLGALANPDPKPAPKDPNNPFASPISILVIGGLIVAGLVLTRGGKK